MTDWPPDASKDAELLSHQGSQPLLNGALPSSPQQATIEVKQVSNTLPLESKQALKYLILPG